VLDALVRAPLLEAVVTRSDTDREGRWCEVAVGHHLDYLFARLGNALAGVALIQSNLPHPLFRIAGLILAPLFVIGSLEFVGPLKPRGWKPAGTLVPLAYIGSSLWLLACRSAGHRLTSPPPGQRS
jgi:hypothetical protein